MYDICIVGAGIVGLSTAYKLIESDPDLKIILLEKEKEICVHQSGNNSGVMHSGIYYKPGSLKAKNCKYGYQKLIEFCEKEDINYELCGKVIVATSEKERPLLKNIYKRGLENGLEGLEMITASRVKEIEPYVNCIEGIWVPQAGIIDYKEVAKKLYDKLREKGVKFRFNSKVRDFKEHGKAQEIITSNQSYLAKCIVNCGGLYSDKLALKTGEEIEYKIIPFRGEYYELKESKRYLVKKLIYPVPNPAFPFLGVHFTRRIDGSVEAGPNAVLAFKREGYKKTQVNTKEFFESISYPGFFHLAKKYWKEGWNEMYRSFSKKSFVKTMQTLIPEINSEDVVRGGAGVRAQAIKRDGSIVDDFLIKKKNKIINVCNAPSPAATSSLSIGEYIANVVMNEM